jgi:predicted DNA-binding transcriptional regulator YafY
MIRTLHSARRSLRAALAAGRHVVSAAISAHHRLLVRLLTAADTGAVLRIRYQDQHGQVSVRDISPRTLRATNAGRITVRAFDWRDGDDTTFRTDRMQLAA